MTGPMGVELTLMASVLPSKSNNLALENNWMWFLEEEISEGQTSEMRKRFGNLGVDSNTPSPAVTNTGPILSSL